MACHSQVFLTFAWSASGWKLVHPTSNGSPSRLQRLVVNSPSAADVTRKSGSPKNAAVRLNSSPVFRLAMIPKAQSDVRIERALRTEADQAAQVDRDLGDRPNRQERVGLHVVGGERRPRPAIR